MKQGKDAKSTRHAGPAGKPSFLLTQKLVYLPLWWLKITKLAGFVSAVISMACKALAVIQRFSSLKPRCKATPCSVYCCREAQACAPHSRHALVLHEISVNTSCRFVRVCLIHPVQHSRLRKCWSRPSPLFSCKKHGALEWQTARLRRGNTQFPLLRWRSSTAFYDHFEVKLAEFLISWVNEHLSFAWFPSSSAYSLRHVRVLPRLQSSRIGFLFVILLSSSSSSSCICWPLSELR